MYELLRYYEDIPYLGKSHAFSNMILEDAYLPEDHEKELEQILIQPSLFIANARIIQYL